MLEQNAFKKVGHFCMMVPSLSTVFLKLTPELP